MKGSFSVDLENTFTEICHEGNGRLMIVRWFGVSSRRISVALTSLPTSVLFVAGNTLFCGIIQLEVTSLMYSLRREIFLTRFDPSHTVGTHYLQCRFLQLMK